MHNQRPQPQYTIRTNPHRGMFTITITGFLVATILLFWLPRTLKAQVIKNQITTNHVLYDVAWSPDGELIAAGARDGIGIYRSDTLEEIAFLQGNEAVSVSWRPDSNQLAGVSGFGEGQGTILIWSRNPNDNFTLQQSLPNGHYQVAVVSWSPDGSQLATIGREYPEGFLGSMDVVELWDTKTWVKTTVSSDRYFNLTYDLDWSPDSQWVAISGKIDCEGQPACDSYSSIGYFILNAKTAKQVRQLESREFPSSHSWAQDGRLAVDNPEIAVFDSLNGQLISTLDGTGAYRMEWSPNGMWLATSQVRNGEIRLKNVPVGGKTVVFQSADKFYAFAWKPDGSQLVTVSESGVMQVWDMSDLPDLSGTPTITPYSTFTLTQEPTPTTTNKK
ncbi:MAG TPA: hypothetical protein VHO69_12545 [Phototrophicaceae bacterium]|nr:hypothetical protein [Phototrophicaceae bacterium]